jgi:hypothetical protein
LKSALDFKQASIDHAIKGLLRSNLIFLFLIDFEPDRAGIIAIIFFVLPL